MSKERKGSSGIGFSGLLTIVFITLKLIGKIDWSWWWVWSPIWIPVAAIAVGFIIYLTYMMIEERYDSKRQWKKIKAQIDEYERTHKHNDQARIFRAPGLLSI